MSDDVSKEFRRGAAFAVIRFMTPHMMFDPGLGKPPMEFKPGSVTALAERLDQFVETGRLPPPPKTENGT